MLTAKQIAALQPQEKSYRVADQRNLFLRVDPSGAKYWVANVTKRGKRTSMSFGRWPDVSAVEARSMLAQESGDAQSHRAGITFEELARQWHGVHETRLTSSKYSVQILRRIDVDIFPSIGSDDISDLTRRKLIDAVTAVSKRGAVETARRLAQYICRILDYAVDCGYIDSHPGSGLVRVLPTVQERHHHALSPQDSGPLYAAIWSYRHDMVVATALRILALTVVRSSELAKARWDEVKDDVWIIPADRMKRRIPHVVPLSRQAQDEFSRLRGITDGYVFQSGRSHIHPETPRRALNLMGFAGVQTSHGLRSIFSSAANESCLWSADAIERQLAHKETDAVRAAYHRAEHLEERTRIMQWWADWIDEKRAIK